MNIKYIEVGVCGLSCRLCPMYNSQAQSRCAGCKSLSRMTVGCPFITCAVKNKNIEFCWQCKDCDSCKKWEKHRIASAQQDSFKCYQTLQSDIAFIRKHGVDEFERQQKIRESILKEMLLNFNEGRSKSYYCVAATVFALEELKDAMKKAKQQSNSLPLKQKAKTMHLLLEKIAKDKGYTLKLRK